MDITIRDWATVDSCHKWALVQSYENNGKESLEIFDWIVAESREGAKMIGKSLGYCDFEVKSIEESQGIVDHS